jgi:hypothetical protein
MDDDYVFPPLFSQPSMTGPAIICSDNLDGCFAANVDMISS